MLVSVHFLVSMDSYESLRQYFLLYLQTQNHYVLLKYIQLRSEQELFQNIILQNLKLLVVYQSSEGFFLLLRHNHLFQFH